VVFDPDKIADTATYENPRSFPVGIPHVLVNGTLAVKDGKQTDALAGKVLRKNR
jgi:N-acyl-D-amino-acid deacylase